LDDEDLDDEDLDLLDLLFIADFAIIEFEFERKI